MLLLSPKAKSGAHQPGRTSRQYRLIYKLEALKALLTLLAVLTIGFGVGVLTLQLVANSNGLWFPWQNSPEVSTNENFVKSSRSTQLDLNNTSSVFSYVFSQLNKNVTVYPTENYYYFRFNNGPHEIWGNIRLDVQDRSEGKISFAYFSTANRREYPLTKIQELRHQYFTGAEGLTITQQSALAFDVTYQGKTTTFHLNDIPQTMPENLPLGEHEQFLYRTFDESGFQFVLLLNKEPPTFRFVLDPTAPLPDTLHELRENLLIGQRSGFAFYRDSLSRLVLVGVDYANLRKNNYYDGPFDQLADNFVTDNTLLDALTLVFPEYKDKLSPRGIFLHDDGSLKNSRVALQPHLLYYSHENLLDFVSSCEQQQENDSNRLLACLTRDRKQTN